MKKKCSVGARDLISHSGSQGNSALMVRCNASVSG